MDTPKRVNIRAADREKFLGPLVKKCVGPYSSKKSINGPHASDKTIKGPHVSDYAVKGPMQCNVMINAKTSVVDYYRTEFIVRSTVKIIYNT